jgi:hypothetical protein
LSSCYPLWLWFPSSYPKSTLYLRQSQGVFFRFSFRRSILYETVKSDSKIFPKPLPSLELRPMDTLAKSNLTISMPPPLVGLVKVSPLYRFGMGFARGYPTFGGYTRVVRLFTTLHRGLSPPHIRGVRSLSPNRGFFCFPSNGG